MKIKKLLPLFLVGSFALAMPIALVSCGTSTSENSNQDTQYQEEIKTTNDIISRVNEKYVVDFFLSADGEFNSLNVVSDLNQITKSIEEFQKEIFPEGKWYKHKQDSTYGVYYEAQNFKNIEGFKTFINYSDDWSTYVYDDSKENGINLNGQLDLKDLMFENINSDLLDGKVKIFDRDKVTVEVSFIPKENVVWKSNNENYHVWFCLYFQKPENQQSTPIENYSTQDQKVNDVVNNTNWKYDLYDKYGEDELLFGNLVDKNKMNFYNMTIDEIKKLFSPNQNNWTESKNKFGFTLYTLKNYKNIDGLKQFFSLTEFLSGFWASSRLTPLDTQDLNYDSILSNNVSSELTISKFEKDENTADSNVTESINIYLKIKLKDGYVWESTDYKYLVSFFAIQTKNDVNTI